MDRVAVFVDAGYLFAAGGQLLTGARTTRGEIQLDVVAVEEALREFAEAESGLPLLRIYWYDGTDSGPSADHTRLMWTKNVKVRLGIANSYGEQKGVDSLLVSDMINLSRSERLASYVLLTGDEDIRVGVQQAQAAGLRVHLLGIAPIRENQSNLLQQEADVSHEWGEQSVRRFLSCRGRISPVEVAVSDSASREEVINRIVEALVASIDENTRRNLRAAFASGQQSVPREYDIALIKALTSHFDDIEEKDKWSLRAIFKNLV
jgi:uncharacterized LabA/DUF88 family protein